MPATRIAMLSGVAWLVSGSLTALLALLEFVLAGGTNDLALFAGWNALAAFASLAAGIALVLRPPRALIGPRALLALSAVWGIVLVAWSTFQMINGAIHWAYLGATVAAFIALVLSIDARLRWTDTDTRPEGGR